MMLLPYTVGITKILPTLLPNVKRTDCMAVSKQHRKTGFSNTRCASLAPPEKPEATPGIS